MTIRLKCCVTVFAIAAGAITTAAAQPMGPGPRGAGWDMGPGMMMGPGTMDRGMYRRMCGPGAAGFSEWRIARLEEIVKPTQAQRGKLDELKAASAKAAETMRDACPSDFPVTMPGRLAAMEKRMDASLQAVRTVKPALDAFYATLDSEQKTRLDSSGGRHRFWRWREL